MQQEQDVGMLTRFGRSASAFAEGIGSMLDFTLANSRYGAKAILIFIALTLIIWFGKDTMYEDWNTTRQMAILFPVDWVNEDKMATAFAYLLILIPPVFYWYYAISGNVNYRTGAIVVLGLDAVLDYLIRFSPPKVLFGEAFNPDAHNYLLTLLAGIGTQSTLLWMESFADYVSAIFMAAALSLILFTVFSDFVISRFVPDWFEQLPFAALTLVSGVRRFLGAFGKTISALDKVNSIMDTMYGENTDPTRKPPPLSPPTGQPRRGGNPPPEVSNPYQDRRSQHQQGQQGQHGGKGGKQQQNQSARQFTPTQTQATAQTGFFDDD